MITAVNSIRSVPDTIVSPHRNLTDAIVQRGLSRIRPVVSHMTAGRCEIVRHSHLASELGSKILNLGMSQIHLLKWTSTGLVETITTRAPDDPITVYMPIVGNFLARQKACEVSLCPGRMMIVSGRDSVHRQFSGRIDLINVLLPRDKFRILMRREIGRDDLFTDDDDIMVRDINYNGPFIQMLGTILADAASTYRSFEGALEEPVEEIMSTLCLRAISMENGLSTSSSMIIVPHYIVLAERFISENWQRPIGIEDLVAATGVSKRTLQYGFRHYRGTTPMAAVKFKRIAAARDALINSQGRVTDVALSTGYQDPSHFARDYKRITGELPRMTIRNRCDQPA